MSPNRNILIVSGEPSGDLHASDLVRNMTKLEAGLKFYGIGGGLSRAAGVETLCDIGELSVVGLIEVVKHIRPIKKAFLAVLDRVDKERPALAILIDYPGFNLRLAKELKKRSVPAAYYVSPQVWAWGADRIRIIKECVRRVFVFFKFEEEFYKERGVDAEFVGNPIVDTAKPNLTRDEVLKKYGLSGKRRIITLLPGSRQGEMRRLLGPMLGAAKKIRARLGDVRFIVSKFRELPREFFEKALKESGVEAMIAEDDTYNILSVSDFAIVASGTATLETALVGTPFVITYRTNLFTWIVANLVVNVEHAGIINIVAGREIVPEFLQYDATPQKLARACVDILESPERLARMKEDLAGLRKLLGPPGASHRAAASILKLLKQQP